MEGIETVTVRSSRFENAVLALSSTNSTPTLFGNRFANNLTAIEVSGDAVPAAVTRNIFLDNRVAIANRTSLPLVAAENFWGSVDSTEIAALFTGQVDFSPFLDAEPDLTAVLDEGASTPAVFALGAPFPNPFNARTAIRFELATAAAASLEIFDILGKRVRTLPVGSIGAGSHQQIWDGRDQRGRRVGSGIYLIRLSTAGSKRARRVVLLR
jgi:hypothetical protein